MSPLAKLSLMIARMLLAGWVGAASLFVVNGVRLVTSGHFESLARDQISLIRFPPYYLGGFVAVGVSIVALAMVSGFPRRLPLGLLGLALVIMLADYFAVYRPLAGMITPPGQSRPPGFESYHQASMWINAVHVGLCLLAGLLICWPRPLDPSNESETT